MTTSYSLRRRLLAIIMIATAIIGFIALADTWREAQAIARNLSDRVLAGSAMAIAEKVTLDETGGLEVEVPFSALEMLASAADDKVFYRVDGAGSVRITGYAALQPVVTDASGVGFADALLGSDPVRSATVVRELSTGSSLISFSITVAETTLARNALAKTILLRSIVRLFSLFAIILVIVWLSVTLALRPLDKIGVAIGLRSPDDLSALSMPGPSEALPLVFGMNSFMARLSKALGALRNFTGNASHQLRTPLSVIGTQLAIARRANSSAEIEASLAKADAAVIRAERVLAQLLLMARVDETAGNTGVVQADIAAISREVVAEFIPAAVLRDCDLGHDGADRIVACIEPVLFGEMVRNLIDNALKHTPHGTKVTVSTHRTENAAVLKVEDSGPGLQSAALEKWRRGKPMRLKSGTPATGETGTDSHGLGLAIIVEIAERSGAAVTLTTRPQVNGTLVEIVFPVPAAFKPVIEPV